MDYYGNYFSNTVQKHKVFISFYHYDDQFYRNEFERLFGHLFINKSVDDGDIDSDNSDEYIKRLIQEDYICDASVVIVLCGPETYKRKHVDWEISAALNKKIGGYSGLLGIHLPEHPDYKTDKYNINNIPARLGDNLTSGFASIYDWSEDVNLMKNHIETAFTQREKDYLIDNRRIQMKYNLG